MSWSDLLAMLPVLILAFGATAILMAGAWYRAPQPLLAGGIATALLLSAPVALVLAGALTFKRFAGRQSLRLLVHAGMGLPAVIVGLPCFRFRIVGHYFALVTLALSVV